MGHLLTAVLLSEHRFTFPATLPALMVRAALTASLCFAPTMPGLHME